MFHLRSRRAMVKRGFSNEVQGVIRNMKSKKLKYHMLQKDKDCSASSKMEDSAPKNGHLNVPSGSKRHGFEVPREKLKSFFEKKIPLSFPIYGEGKGRTVKRLHENADDAYAPHDVPEGHTVVYVGRERRQFVINLKTLHHPAFQMLLKRLAEEFGFEQKGGLAVPCQVFFQHLLWCIETDNCALSSMQIHEIQDFYACSDY